MILLRLKYVLILLLATLFAWEGFSQTTETYATAGAYSWICPAGVTSVTVTGWGGGGGGGSSNNGSNNGGSGGGGGAFAESVFTVTPGQTYYIEVAANGDGSISNTSDATDGGSSWFNSVNSAPTDNTGLLAAGGLKGIDNTTVTPNNRALAANCFYNVVAYNGGNGRQAASTYGSGGGSSAGTAANGVSATGIPGATAPAGGGNGGAGSSNNGANSGNGSDGLSPGGGGGGSDDQAGKNGGNGGVGQLILEYILPTDAEFVTPSLALSNIFISATSSYTFSQTVPTDVAEDLGIAVGASVTVTIPNGDLSGATGTFNGQAIVGMTNPTATTLVFTVPAGGSIAESASFDIVINGIVNFNTPGTYNTASIIATNITTGYDYFNSYTYTLIDADAEFLNSSLAISDDNISAVGVSYTFTQDVPSSLLTDYGIAAGALVTVTLPNGDFSLADPTTSTFNGQAITAWSSQSATELVFIVPALGDVAEGASFNIVITNVTNFNTVGTYNTNSVIVENNAGGTDFYNSYSYNLLDRNVSFTNTSLAISDNYINTVGVTYTFTQTIPNDALLNLGISATQIITVTVPDGDLSLATGTFNGLAITTINSQTSTEIIFEVPVGADVAEGAAFDIVLNGVTNFNTPGTYSSCSVVSENGEVGGTNFFNTYSYTLILDLFGDFGATSLVLSDQQINNVSDYTFNQTVPTSPDQDFGITAGASVTITNPNGTFPATPQVGTTWNGIPILAWDSQSSTEVVFTVPMGGDLIEGDAFSIVISGVTNHSLSGTYNTSSVTSENNALGTNTYTTYSFTLNGIINATFTSPTLTLSDNFVSNAGVDYTFTQTIPVDAVLDLGIVAGHFVTITVPNGDLSAATGGTFNGQVIGAFTSQTSTEVVFQVPVGGDVLEGVPFDVVLNNVTNYGVAGTYSNGAVVSENNEVGGSNSFYTYSYTLTSNAYGTFGQTSLTLSDAQISNLSDYTFTQTVPSSATTNLNILPGALVTVTIPNGDFTSVNFATCTFAGVPLDAAFISQSPTTLVFVVPAAVNPTDLEEGDSFEILVSGATNHSVAGDYTSSAVSVVNADGGVNSYNFYSYSLFVTTAGMFTATSLTISEDQISLVSNYTFTQTVPIDAIADYGITGGAASVTVTIPNGDFSTATLAGSTINGDPIAAFTTQNATTLIFDVPVSVLLNEGDQFDIVIAGVTNHSVDGTYVTASVVADNNDATTNSFSSYSYTLVISDGIFGVTSLSLTNPVISVVSDYTFTQTIPVSAFSNLGIVGGASVTITIPNGDLSTANFATSTFGGVPLDANFTSQTATSLVFTVPMSVNPGNLEEGDVFSVMISGVTNHSVAGAYNTSTLTVENIAGGTDTYTSYEYTLIDPNATFIVGSNVTLSDAVISNVSDYTFTQTIPSNVTIDLGILAGAQVTITIPNGDLSSVDFSTSTFAGVLLDAGFISQSATSLVFVVPAGVNPTDLEEGDSFDIMLSGATNHSVVGTYNTATVSVENASTGVNSYTSYTYNLIETYFTATSLTLSNNDVSNVSSYTFTQTVPNDGGAYDLGLSSGALVTVSLPNGDLSSATIAGSTFNGVAVTAWASQSATELVFAIPVGGDVAESVSFDIVIAGVTNYSISGTYSNAAVYAINNEGSVDLYESYSYTLDCGVGGGEASTITKSTYTICPGATEIVTWTIDENANGTIPQNSNGSITFKFDSQSNFIFTGSSLSVSITSSPNIDLNDGFAAPTISIIDAYTIQVSGLQTGAGGGFTNSDDQLIITAEVQGVSLGTDVIRRCGGSFSTNFINQGSEVANLLTSNMSYVSTVVTQADVSQVPPNSVGNEILGYKITASGSCSPLSVTELVWDMSGTTSVTDVSNASVYFTGSSPIYASIGLFGSQASPSGTTTITGSQVLADGDNYFWIAYDLPITAETGNFVDAAAISVTVGGTSYDISANPAGNREIGAAFTCGFNGIWKNTVWNTINCTDPATFTRPGAGTNVNVCNGVTITLDQDESVKNIVVDGIVDIGTSNLTVYGNINFVSGSIIGTSGNLILAGANKQITGDGTINLTTGSVKVDDDYNIAATAVVSILGFGNVDFNVTGKTLTNNGYLSMKTFSKTGGPTVGTFKNASGSTLALTTNGTPWNSTSISVDLDDAPNTFICESTVTISVNGKPVSNKFWNVIVNAGTFSLATDNYSINGDLTVSGGIFEPGTSTYLLLGNVSLTSGTINTVPSTTTFTGLGHFLVSGGTFNGGASTFDFSGDLITSAGLMNLNTSSFTIQGNATISGGIVNANTSNTFVYNDAFISGGTCNILTSTTTISGNLEISAGTLDGGTTGIINLSGDWINTGGTFACNTGTVNFEGGNQTVTNALGETFYDVDISNIGSTLFLENNIFITNTLEWTTEGYIDVSTFDATLSINNWDDGDVVGLGTSTDRAIILTETGNVVATGVSNGETANLPVSFGIGDSEYARVDIAPVTVGTETYTISNLCNYVNIEGTCAGGTQVTDWGVEYTWQIDCSNPASTANVTLYWDNVAKILNAFDETNCVVNHHDGLQWNVVGAFGAANVYNGTVYSLTGLGPSFSPYGVSSGTGPLPIELLSFDASLSQDNKVDIEWVTASELNNEYFNVERSNDGINFEPIEKVKGAGNSNKELNYSTIDNDPFDGLNYYRLMQVDFDGQHSYSDIRKVLVNKNRNIADAVNMEVYPNPILSGTNSVNLMFTGLGTNEEVLVVLTDIVGKEFYTKVIVTEESGDVISAIDTMSHLPAGTYIITGSSNNNYFSKKLIIN